VHYRLSKSLLFVLLVILSAATLSLFSDDQATAATLQLSWADNSSDETGFHVERKLGVAGEYSVIATTSANVTSYDDSGLADNTTYCYRVNAFNSAGNSAYSPELCGTTLAAPIATLNLTVSSQGSGTITSTPAGINCGTTCTASFTNGASVTLQAVAASGYTFSGWSGHADCVDGSVTMNTNKTCTATFTPITVQTPKVTVNILATATAAGTGKGVVTSSPAGINCKTNCSANFASGTSVTLIATPNPGSVFSGWSGDPDCSDGAVTMDSNKSCVAIFTINTSQNPKLIVNVVGEVTTAGTGTGIVTSSPVGINCGSTCAADFSKGATVALTPTPASGSVFSGWSGDPDCFDGVVIMNRNKTCTAMFAVKGNTLNVSLKGNGKGRITGSPGSIDCVTDCSANFAAATRVVLRAAPALGSAFTGWSGDRNCAGGVVVANGNTSCVATFEQRPSSIGVFKTTTHEWQLKRNITATNNGCNTDSCINPWKKKSIPTLGSVLVPIVGDWDGSGVDDLGLYSSSATGNKGSRWYLDRNGNEKWNGCDGDRCIRSFGKQGDIPVAGDWNGAGRSKIGVFRPATGEWFLDLDGDGRLDGCSIDRCIASFGQQGDLAVAGDWDAAGTSKIGLFRPSTGEWFLDRNGNGIWDGCNVDQCVTAFGQPGDLPVAGDWDATGSTKIGVFRPKTGDWFLDLNGNGQWDGCNVDKCLSGFGQEGDLPVAGRW